MLRIPLAAASLVMGLVACAPPPEVAGGGEPSIRVIHPPGDVGAVALDDEGRLRILVVVDVNDLAFVPPSVSNLIPVEGEGHWHLTVNGVYKGAPDAEFVDYVSGSDEFAVGTAMSLRVSLATNDHIDLNQFPGWEAVVEFDIEAALTR